MFNQVVSGSMQPGQEKGGTADVKLDVTASQAQPYASKGSFLRPWSGMSIKRKTYLAAPLSA